MKICVFTAQIGNYHDARFRALFAAGADFVVFSSQNDASFSEFMVDSSHDYSVERLCRNRADYLRRCADGRIWHDVHRRLTQISPDVLAVAGWASPESFAAIAWARQAQRRIVMMSDSKQTDAKRKRWRERVKGRTVGLCDAALVAGPPHRAYISGLGIPLDRVHMGYDVVDNSHFDSGAERAQESPQAAKRALGLPKRYLLASARFIPKKNLPRLIVAYGQAIAGLAAAPDLVILGDGPTRPEVEAAIVSAGVIGKVYLPGFRGYDLLPAIYALSDGFVHISTSEQWGLVINEACAAGVPVIASSACGATSSLVRHGSSGWVVDAHDTAVIAQAIRDLATVNDARRREMGLAGRRLVADWGPERFASELLAASREAMAQTARSLTPWDAVLLRLLARQISTEIQ